VIRIPDLDMRYHRAVDSLVAEHRAALIAAQTLVVDMRGDGGGCTCTYDALIPFVATGPVRGDGLEVWASPANVTWLRSLVADPATPDTLRAALRRLLPRLDVAPNTFVSWSASRDDYVPRRVLSRPAAVAVLVDSICASSCEDFVRAVRQSRKATVFSATNTAGAGDYGNVRAVPLPGWRRLRVATSRSMRLRAGRFTDFVGIAPDVRLPRDSAVGDAAIAFALRHHRTRSGATSRTR
jgi:C-terminal processing protease CtpA/Prc